MGSALCWCKSCTVAVNEELMCSSSSVHGCFLPIHPPLPETCLKRSCPIRRHFLSHPAVLPEKLKKKRKRENQEIQIKLHRILFLRLILNQDGTRSGESSAEKWSQGALSDCTTAVHIVYAGLFAVTRHATLSELQPCIPSA